MKNPTVIGCHFTMLTAWTLWPCISPCKDAEEALELARNEIKDGNDPYEGSYGYLTVYDDGSLAHYEFSTDELKGPQLPNPEAVSEFLDRFIEPR